MTGLITDVPYAWLDELLQHYRDEEEYFLRDGEDAHAAVWHEKAENLERFLKRAVDRAAGHSVRA